MYRRINVTLPEETIQLLDRIATKGDRSRLIDEAVRYYITETEKSKLKQQLKEGGIRRAERDLDLADAWFNLEEEAWLPDKE